MAWTESGTKPITPGYNKSWHCVGRSTLNDNVCQYFFLLNLDIIMFGSTESVVTTTTEDLLALKYPSSIAKERAEQIIKIEAMVKICQNELGTCLKCLKWSF